MALPSQNARPLARRTFMHRRGGRQRSPRLVVFLVLLVAVVGLVWLLWPSGAPADADPTMPESQATAMLDDDATLLTSRETPDEGGTAARSEPPVTELPAARIDEDAPLVVQRPREEQRDPEIETARSATPPPAVLATPARIMPEPDRTAPMSAAARRARTQLEHALDLIDRNQPIEARAALSDVLLRGGLSDAEAGATRARIAELNERILFAPEIVPGDPFAFRYTIESNDALSRLPRKLGLQVDWRFLQRINRIQRPERIRLDQRIKVVTGPFHAVVSKRDYRMDLYLGDEPERVYVRSFDVGLGERDSTPIGRFVVRPNSKLINPEWSNPQTGERFLPDDPLNPIGDYWLGLVGDEPHLAEMHGYGIHGTIEPDSIGRQASMGCIRMRKDDVALVWELLVSGVSRVQIVP